MARAPDAVTVVSGVMTIGREAAGEGIRTAGASHHGAAFGTWVEELKRRGVVPQKMVFQRREWEDPDSEPGWGLVAHVVLVAEMDNPYDPEAVAIHAAPARARLPMGERVAYIPNDRRLRAARTAVRELDADTAAPVGAWCWIPVVPAEHFDGEPSNDSVETPSAEWIATTGGMRLLLPDEGRLESLVAQSLGSEGVVDPAGAGDVERWAAFSRATAHLRPTVVDDHHGDLILLRTDSGAPVGEYDVGLRLLMLDDERARASATEMLVSHGLPAQDVVRGIQDERDFADAAMRTKEGLAVARAKGRLNGKPPKLSQRQHMKVLTEYELGTTTPGELAQDYGVDRATIYRTIDRAKKMREGSQ